MAEAACLGVGRAGGMAEAPCLGVGRPEGMADVLCLGVGRCEEMEKAGRLEVIEGGGRMDGERFGWAEGRGTRGVAGGGKR